MNWVMKELTTTDSKLNAVHIIFIYSNRWVNMAPYRWCRAMLYHAEHARSPAAILKKISPGDAQILEDAAGLRVRMRLGRILNRINR